MREHTVAAGAAVPKVAGTLRRAVRIEVLPSPLCRSCLATFPPETERFKTHSPPGRDGRVFPISLTHHA